MDGVSLDDETAYTVEGDDAASITLRSEYLDTLDPGTHTITLVFQAGPLEVTLTVASEEETQIPADTTGEDTNGTGSNAGEMQTPADTSGTGSEAGETVTSPQTGDLSPSVPLFLIALAFAAAAAVALFLGKAKQTRSKTR